MLYNTSYKGASFSGRTWLSKSHDEGSIPSAPAPLKIISSHIERLNRLTGWVDVYQEDFDLTGEYGSVVVRGLDRSIRFIAHHFTKEEIGSLMGDFGVRDLQFREVLVESSVSRKIRANWNVWGYIETKN